MRSRLFTVIALVALVATACGSSSGGGGSSGSGTKSDAAPVEGGELIVGRSGQIDGLEGDQCLGAGSIVVNPLIYDTLQRIASDGQGLVAGLATDVAYDADALTYTYTIRDGAKFSDGSDLQADDVVFSIEQWKAGKISGSYFSMIDSVEATDPQTVVIHLTEANTFLPNLFAWCTSTVYPKDFGGETAEAYFKQPVSAGPFTLDSWTNPGPSETIHLVKNKYFWDSGKPYLDAIEFQSSTDAGQRSLAFENGQIDVIEGLDAISAQTLPKESVEFTDAMPIQELLVNSKAKGLEDAKVRQAISLAIDRDQIIEALDGHGEPAIGVLPINVPFSVPGSEKLSTDTAQAESLLKDADATNLSVDLLYDNTGGDDATVAEVIADQLGKVGIDVKLVPSDSGTIFGRAGSGDFELAISGVAAVSPTAFDPVSFLQFTYYPWTGADSTVISEQYAIGVASDDDAAREDAIKAIQDDAWDQSTVIGLYNSTPGYAVADRVSGFDPLSYLVWYADDTSVGG